MSMTATARRAGNGVKHEVDVNGRHLLITDEPTSLGGSDEGPAPHELLPAALAACTATMIAMYATKRGWELGDVAVDVDYDPDAVPRHFDVCLQLPEGLSAEQVKRLRRVGDTCPVRRALETGCTFDEQLVSPHRHGHEDAA
jgi:putative redox protein